MDFYQQLQLSSIGSKQWIKGAKDSKEKHKRILIYNFKVYLVVAFCFAVVTDPVCALKVFVFIIIVKRRIAHAYHALLTKKCKKSVRACN